MDIARGQRIKLQDLISSSKRFTLELRLDAGGLSVDAACFGLDAAKKLSDESYMTFFNQPSTPCGGVSLVGTGRFEFDLERLPHAISSLVVTLAIDGPGTMNGLRPSALHVVHEGVEVAAHRFDGSAFAAERAIMLVELYRKDEVWRLNAIGQGFNGGLDALIVHFGGTVAEPAASSPPAPAVSAPTPAPAPDPTRSALSLEKRVEKEAPHLISLVKKVGVSLEKAGLSGHKARVALCLDISASMSRLYSSGQMAAFTERILALATRFDDDGQLDVFLFGNDVHQPEPMDLANSRGYIERLLKRYRLEGGTRYGVAMQAIRHHYYPQGGGAAGKPISARLPVYVMFVTDGQTMDEKLSEQQVRDSSFEPIFWQFMGIGKSNKAGNTKKGFFARLLETDFSFLEKLDSLDGRYIDNANFFSVEIPDQQSDEELYALLLSEYKGWLPLARQRGLLV